CDGLDNDCDGTVDENITRSCFTGDFARVGTGLCVEGTQSCDNGVFLDDCEGEVVPISEDSGSGNVDLYCDQLDNDCDGEADEACLCSPGQTRECYTLGTSHESLDHRPCQLGIQTCGEDARFAQECVGQVIPGVESCQNPGVDNDCDGVADNVVFTQGDDDLEVGDDCLPDDAEVGYQSFCTDGVVSCSGQTGAAAFCSPLNARTPEVCDGIDNDCNGAVDDLSVIGDECYVTSYDGNDVFGECRYGTTQCVQDGPSFELLCVPGSKQQETCNELDDDCDNSADEETGNGSFPGVQLETDEANCGYCGNECSGAEGECCDYGCVDTDTDVAHCGGCGNHCDDILGDADEAACCDAGCVDLAYDDDNCGECGEACTGDEDTCCDSGCVDTSVDPFNCGGCGITCGGAQICCGGQCVEEDSPDTCGSCDVQCSDSQGCCEEAELTCVDFTQDGNCGACGATCGSGSACCVENGEDVGACLALDIDGNCGGCGVSCEETLTNPTAPVCCDNDENGVGACADVDDDEQNCGECGNNCSGQFGDCCGGGCVDVETDEANCGTCGHACTGDEDACCDSGCVDLSSDALNCGECGNDCDPGDLCCNGFCFAPSNPLNCGECGNVCNTAIGQTCVETSPDVFSCQVSGG
ncbi:MAG: hypothetical protein KC561_12810, partial [Myxococcales bacterium]|nr:hypothetical protein [Myxococcales bacterium]